MNEERWSEADSREFLTYADYFVPQRLQQIAIVCELLKPRRPRQIVDLCCGSGALTEALLEQLPEAEVAGFDGSPAMLQAAASRLARFSTRFEPCLFDLAAGDWRRRPESADAVVSMLGIHHLDDEGKRRLFRDLHGLLRPGGDLLIADIIQPMTTEAVQLAAERWDDAVRSASMDGPGNLSAYDRFAELEWNNFRLATPDPVDKMSPIHGQLNWLTEAGFETVDVFWMEAGHAVFGGRRKET